MALRSRCLKATPVRTPPYFHFWHKPKTPNTSQRDIVGQNGGEGREAGREGEGRGGRNQPSRGTRSCSRTLPWNLLDVNPACCNVSPFCSYDILRPKMECSAYLSFENSRSIVTYRSSFSLGLGFSVHGFRTSAEVAKWRSRRPHSSTTSPP